MSTQTGVTRQGLNFSQVRNLPFLILPIEEQRELFKLISQFFEKEKKLIEIIHLEDNLEILKQSILSKAFRGELGTNDLTEESAIEILKEILQEKE